MDKILALTKLSDKRKAEVRALEAACRAVDGTEAVAELSNEMNFSRRLKCFFLYYEENELTGFMGIFCPDGENAEIQAFTAPEKRRMGVFRTLLEPAGEELKYNNVKQVYFVAEPVSEAAKKTAKAMGMKRKYSELVMRLENYGETRPHGNLIIEKRIEDGELTFELRGAEEDIVYGELSAQVGERTVFIYGVEIEEQYRGQGLGKALVETTLGVIRKDYPKHDVKLHVTDTNQPAMKIYRGCGFVVESERIYYAIK
ncbi:MAG: GNAT family N-acetyltransferase [Lachnospiraceae bacterium]|nr:GNAT family N-acetyltransferase [Lachnospiraceae bacterium]